MFICMFMMVIFREYVNVKYWYNMVVVNIGEIFVVDFLFIFEIKNIFFEFGYVIMKEFLFKKCVGFMRSSVF